MNDKTFAELDLEDLTQVSGGCHGNASYAGQTDGDLAMDQTGMGQLGMGQLEMSGQLGMGACNGGYAIDTPAFEGGLLCVGPSQGAIGTQNLMSFVNSPAFYQTIASPSAWSNAAASLVRPGNDASLGHSPQTFFGGPNTRIA